MTSAIQKERVRIVDFNETRVAAFEHRDDPELIGDSIRQFIAWRKENHLPPKMSATFNIVYDNPDEVSPEDYRIDICAATDREIAPHVAGVVSKIIPAGRCAVLRHIGPDDTLDETVRQLYADWLPQSGEEPRDFPLFFQRVLSRCAGERGRYRCVFAAGSEVVEFVAGAMCSACHWREIFTVGAFVAAFLATSVCSIESDLLVCFWFVSASHWRKRRRAVSNSISPVIGRRSFVMTHNVPVPHPCGSPMNSRYGTH